MADRSRDVGGRAWSRGGTIYHVYPRSFQDASGDGVGDLAGVRDRLPYLAWLGVDALWLSPFYVSPMADFGYDVADHCDVDPLFGALEDFDALVVEARRLGLRVILDYVPNHTSIEHPWFSEHPEWYLWRDAPNNWLSSFGGSAWTRLGDRFYYHAYLPEQPDLDWRRDDVGRAMLDVLRFWCGRGADGFRIDALRQTIKDAAWRDNPVNPDWEGSSDEYDSLLPVFSTDQPEVQDLVRRFRETVGDRLLIGELYLPIERLVAYYASGLDMPANFHLLTCEWSAGALASLIERYEAALPGGAWPNWVLGNHDRPRIASRLGAAQAPAAALLLTTLRGTPTLYYGDEIGMEDVPVPNPVDPWGRRDPARTPMQWGSRGFSAASPWLPYGDESAISVEGQRDDPGSLLSLYRRLLRVRREFALEPYETLAADDALVFRRGEYVVAVNVSDDEVAVPLRGSVVVATNDARADGEVRLSAGHGLLIRELPE